MRLHSAPAGIRSFSAPLRPPGAALLRSEIASRSCSATAARCVARCLVLRPLYQDRPLSCTSPTPSCFFLCMQCALSHRLGYGGDADERLQSFLGAVGTTTSTFSAKNSIAAYASAFHLMSAEARARGEGFHLHQVALLPRIARLTGRQVSAPITIWRRVPSTARSPIRALRWCDGAQMIKPGVQLVPSSWLSVGAAQ
jgi:hypothetical protein